MPVELHGIYYTVSELADMFGVSVSAMSLYLSRNGYKKVNFSGKKERLSLFHESEVERIKKDREGLFSRYISLQEASKILNCNEDETLLNCRYFKTKEKNGLLTIRFKDVTNAKNFCFDNGKIDWDKVKAVLPLIQ